MRKILFYYSVVATLLLIACALFLRHSTGEVARLRNNNEALTSETQLYKTRLEESVASTVALQLLENPSCCCFLPSDSADNTKRIRELGIRLRRVESVATATTHAEVEFSAPLRDTIFLDCLLPDTSSVFRWSDRWVSIEGIIRNGNAECHIESVDTLRQIVHRVPHKFLFFRYGTKSIRQEITSSNPHTRIVYAQYIELPKRRKRK